MNDMTQMLAGAFSIAVVGSVMFAVYAARLGDAAASLPAEAREVVRDFNRGGGSTGGVAAARRGTRPIHRGEVGVHRRAGSGVIDRRGVLVSRPADRCSVHAGARH